MKTDNELIAEFMGHEFEKESGKWCLQIEGLSKGCWLYGKKSEEFEYKTRWDWLMPVVEKCFDTEFGDDFEGWRKWNGAIHEALQIISIEAVYKAVIDFIKWYNSQKKES